MRIQTSGAAFEFTYAGQVELKIAEIENLSVPIEVLVNNASIGYCRSYGINCC